MDANSIQLGPRVVLKRSAFGWSAFVDDKEVAYGATVRAIAEALQPKHTGGTTLNSGAVETKGTDESWLKDGNWRRVGVQ